MTETRRQLVTMELSTSSTARDLSDGTNHRIRHSRQTMSSSSLFPVSVWAIAAVVVSVLVISSQIGVHATAAAAQEGSSPWYSHRAQNVVRQRAAITMGSGESVGPRRRSSDTAAVTGRLFFFKGTSWSGLWRNNVDCVINRESRNFFQAWRSSCGPSSLAFNWWKRCWLLCFCPASSAHWERLWARAYPLCRPLAIRK